MTYAITYFQEAAYDTSGIELFADEVVPGPGRLSSWRGAPGDPRGPRASGRRGAGTW